MHRSSFPTLLIPTEPEIRRRLLKKSFGPLLNSLGMSFPFLGTGSLDNHNRYYESNTMKATVPFTIKVPIALKRDLAKVAKLRGTSPSATARAFLEEGIAREKPGALLGAGKGTVRFAPDFDPSEPVIPLEDWGDPKP
jgi:hypothetical protein